MSDSATLDEPQMRRAARRGGRLALAPTFILTAYVLMVPYFESRVVYGILHRITWGETIHQEAVNYRAFISSVPFHLFMSMGLQLLNVAFMAMFLVFYRDQPVMARLALRKPTISIPMIALIIIGGLAIARIFSTVAYFLNWPSAATVRIQDFTQMSEGMWKVADFAVTVIVAPLFEEMVFRGYIQTRLARRIGAVAGIVLTSIFFGLLHREWHQGTFAFLTGMYMGVIAHRAGSIVPAIFVHMGINGCAWTLTVFNVRGLAESPWILLLSIIVAFWALHMLARFPQASPFAAIAASRWRTGRRVVPVVTSGSTD